jgi:hypothetical protein
MITGANALAITDWNEQSGYTTLSAISLTAIQKRSLKNLILPLPYNFDAVPGKRVVLHIEMLR